MSSRSSSRGWPLRSMREEANFGQRSRHNMHSSCDPMCIREPSYVHSCSHIGWLWGHVQRSAKPDAHCRIGISNWSWKIHIGILDHVLLGYDWHGLSRYCRLVASNMNIHRGNFILMVDLRMPKVGFHLVMAHPVATAMRLPPRPACLYLLGAGVSQMVGSTRKVRQSNLDSEEISCGTRWRRTTIPIGGIWARRDHFSYWTWEEHETYRMVYACFNTR